MKLNRIFCAVITNIIIFQAYSEEQKQDQAIMLDTLVVTSATRQERKKLEVAENVDIITKKQIDEQSITNLQDLVRHIPGVSLDRQTSGVDPFGNLGGFTIRGATGNRVQMQVDGSRVIERIGDGNRSFIDLSTMKAVEIVRGPSSVLWGADALGGVVAFKTLDPSDLLKGKPYAVQMNLGYNSLNKQKTKTGMVAASFTPNIEGLLALTRRDYNEAKLSNAKANGGIWGCPRGVDAIRCNKLNPLDAEVDNVLAKLVVFTNDHEIKFIGEKFRSNSNVDQLYDYGLQANGSFNGDYSRTQIQTREKLAIEDIWIPNIRFIDQVKTQISYSPQRRYVKSNRKQTSALSVVTNTYSTLDYQEKFWQADFQFTSSFNKFNTNHELTYGFQGDISKTDYDSMTKINNVVNHGTGFNFANATTRRADFYIQDEIKLFSQRLTITPGIRYATYQIKPKTNAHYVLIPGKEPRKQESKKLVPQLGMVFNLTDQYSIYARYAEGFKMPTAQQLYTSRIMGTTNIIPNPNLKAEKVKSYEAGIRGEYENAWFSFGGFRADYSDYIQSLVEIAPNNYTYQNISKVNISGLEASGEWKFSPNWTLNASASYQYGKQKETGSKSSFFNNAMPLEGTIGIKWLYPALNFETEFVGNFSKAVTRTSKRSPSYGEVYKPSGYAVYDAYFNWNATKNITVRGSIQNVFDKRYFKWPLFSTYYKNQTNATKASNPLELQTAPGRAYSVDLVINF